MGTGVPLKGGALAGPEPLPQLALPLAVRPGTVLHGQADAYLEVSLICRTEGRGDPSRSVVARAWSDSSGAFALPVPPAAPPTLHGLLSRTVWEVAAAGEVRRVTVSITGTAPPDPYEAAGWRHNPFIAEAVPERQSDWDGLPDTLWLDLGYSLPPVAAGRQLVQLLGVRGAGKSTHLARWRSLSPGPACYVPLGWRRWQCPAVASICYWDEACRLPGPLLHFALQRAAWQQATVCAGVHRNLSHAARRAGLSVQTIELPGLTARGVQQWAAKRLQAAALPGPCGFPRLTEAECLDFARRAEGSWRALGTLLHIWAARQAGL